MSLAEVHFMVLGWREIQVASFGLDQFSLGGDSTPQGFDGCVDGVVEVGETLVGGEFGG